MSGLKTVRKSHAAVATPPAVHVPLAKVDDALGGVMSDMHQLRRTLDDIWFALEESTEDTDSILSEDERLRIGREAVYKTLQRVLQIERAVEAAMDLCAAATRSASRDAPGTSGRARGR